MVSRLELSVVAGWRSVHSKRGVETSERVGSTNNNGEGQVRGALCSVTCLCVAAVRGSKDNMIAFRMVNLLEWKGRDLCTGFSERQSMLGVSGQVVSRHTGALLIWLPVGRANLANTRQAGASIPACTNRCCRGRAGTWRARRATPVFIRFRGPSSFGLPATQYHCQIRIITINKKVYA